MVDLDNQLVTRNVKPVTLMPEAYKLPAIVTRRIQSVIARMGTNLNQRDSSAVELALESALWQFPESAS